MNESVYVGFDPRETDGFAVTRASMRRRMTKPIPVHGLVLPLLKRSGLFYRDQEKRDGVIWDKISDAPCATEFSISRFLVPFLAERGWAMFCDSDMLFRTNVCRLFDELTPDKALYCVKHDYQPTETVKMDGQQQTQYARKNWSSLMVFNCGHPANKRLTVETVNNLPGRDLHRMCWLEDDEIGELDPAWNWLVGHSNLATTPKNVHFTTGLPSMPGYEQVSFAGEWRRELELWAS